MGWGQVWGKSQRCGSWDLTGHTTWKKEEQPERPQLGSKTPGTVPLLFQGTGATKYSVLFCRLRMRQKVLASFPSHCTAPFSKTAPQTLPEQHRKPNRSAFSLFCGRVQTPSFLWVYTSPSTLSHQHSWVFISQKHLERDILQSAWLDVKTLG